MNVLFACLVLAHSMIVVRLTVFLAVS